MFTNKNQDSPKNLPQGRSMTTSGRQGQQDHTNKTMQPNNGGKQIARGENIGPVPHKHDFTQPHKAPPSRAPQTSNRGQFR